MLRKNYLYYRNIIEDCYLFHKKTFQKVELEILKGRLDLIDEYIEIVADTFCDLGLKEDWEPNEYGLELEEAQDYLLRLRDSICEHEETVK